MRERNDSGVFKKLKEKSPISISELQQASFLKVTVASGRTEKFWLKWTLNSKLMTKEFNIVF